MLTSGLPGLVLETQPEQLLIQTFPSVEIAFWEDQYFSPLKCRVGELVQKYFFIRAARYIACASASAILSVNCVACP